MCFTTENVFKYCESKIEGIRPKYSEFTSPSMLMVNMQQNGQSIMAGMTDSLDPCRNAMAFISLHSK